MALDLVFLLNYLVLINTEKEPYMCEKKQMSIHSGVLDGLQIYAMSQVEMCLAAPRTSVNFIRCAHSFTDFSHLMLCT
jgi:hypothetical protein